MGLFFKKLLKTEKNIKELRRHSEKTTYLTARVFTIALNEITHTVYDIIVLRH